MRHYQQLFDHIPAVSANFLFAAFAVLIVALFFLFRFPKTRWNYLWLFGATALFGTGFALMDPFLHPWDEQFHALVAKNMAEHPFRPTLMEGDCIQHNYKIWTLNEVWLHKQPLFLWQMAASIKLFGANYFAVRIPSIFLHAATTLFVFAIAKRSLSYFFAVLAAVLFGFSGLLNDYVGGAVGMDHNDVAFIFYVTASFWAWVKYDETRLLKWVVLIGLFAGAAILCKWLVGLCVFAGWGMIVLIYERRQLRSWKHLWLAAGIAVVVALPWQLWCATAFPKEFRHEMSLNSLHFVHAVEKHKGDALFYWDGMKDIYGAGDLMRILVVAGLAIAWYTGVRRGNRQLFFAAFSFTLIYAFFTVAATKISGYVLIVSGFGFVFLLLPFDRLVQLIRSRRPVRLPWSSLPLLVLLVLFLQFSPKGIIGRHYYNVPGGIRWTYEIQTAEKLIAQDRSGKCILLKNSSGIGVAAIRFTTGREVFADGKPTCDCVEITLPEKEFAEVLYE
jgi:4-amino-4-deoxy-L-arabinose transferase-like glycosyltransferase